MSANWPPCRVVVVVVVVVLGVSVGAGLPAVMHIAADGRQLMGRHTSAEHAGAQPL